MTSWTRAVSRATDRKALTALVNEYLATWSPAELARLPEACRPDRLRGVEDIEYWRQRLADSYISGGVHDAASDTLSRLIGFLTTASERLAELDAEDGIETGGLGPLPNPRAKDNQAQGD